MTCSSSQSPSVRSARAFTLVEVMVGILILGLGILGLGAIFPAVAIQQRGAADAVEGQTAADAAESIIRGHEQLNLYVPETGASVAIYGGWASALINPGIGKVWDSGDPTQNLVQIDLQTGDLTVGDSSNTLVTTPWQQRLFPAVTPAANANPFAGARFVWDIAARRAKRADYRNPPHASVSTPKWNEREYLQDRVQVALFIRRIDTGIRFRPGNAYVPVAEDAGTGLPTLDGVGLPTNAAPHYAPIRVTQLKPDYSPFPGGQASVPLGARISRVLLNDQAPPPAGMTAATVDAAIGQVGQKFVVQIGGDGDIDVTGLVVTVTRVERTASAPFFSILTIDPPIPHDEFSDVGYGPSAPALFTAQPPVAVRFYTLRDGGVN